MGNNGSPHFHQSKFVLATDAVILTIRLPYFGRSTNKRRNTVTRTRCWHLAILRLHRPFEIRRTARTGTHASLPSFLELEPWTLASFSFRVTPHPQLCALGTGSRCTHVIIGSFHTGLTWPASVPSTRATPKLGWGSSSSSDVILLALSCCTPYVSFLPAILLTTVCLPVIAVFGW